MERNRDGCGIVVITATAFFMELQVSTGGYSPRVGEQLRRLQEVEGNAKGQVRRVLRSGQGVEA